jgi:hypothetical protein
VLGASLAAATDPFDVVLGIDNVASARTGVGTTASGTDIAGLYGSIGALRPASPVANRFGVLGDSRGDIGVIGQSDSNIGVFGASRDGTGVFGRSNNDIGVHAQGRRAQLLLQPGVLPNPPTTGLPLQG